ncbi:MAG: hypothetical protein DRI56_08165 [Chloroflexota bacterium]|nr:MAG: hypothetical protein DRI56_08165 [Chloroflexota bacterium]
MTVAVKDSPVFICGHPKSGTSLLRAMLDSHPQLIVYPEESVFFRRYLPLAQNKPFEEQLQLAEQYLLQMFSWNKTNPPPNQKYYPDRDYTHISFEDTCQAMRKLIAENGYRHPGDILSASVLAYGEVTNQKNQEIKHWVEKTPYNERFAEQIFAWWPEAKCIHIIRDPRDNYASYHQLHPDWTPEFFGANWNMVARIGLKNEARFGKERYLIMRYEDLVKSPAENVKKIIEFLSIQNNITLTTPTRAGRSWKGNSMFADKFQGISDKPVGRWREKLTQREAALLEWKTLFLMKHFSYHAQHRRDISALFKTLSWPLKQRLRRLSKK